LDNEVHGHLGPPKSEKQTEPTIRAELIGADTATAAAVTVHSASPVLVLCRKLIASGVDPAKPLHVFRGGTLVLTVRSIGLGARLRVGSHGVGFERDPECGAGPPMRAVLREAAE
jgi:hypothetical protein